jgi:hypothetical protein
MRRLTIMLVSGGIGLIIFVFSGCGGKIADADMAAAARSMVGQYAEELKTELYAALEDSGTVWAVRICSERAPEISAHYSSIPGWTLKRVSARYRNPQNAPDEFESESLEILENRPATSGDEYYRWEEEGGHKSFRFMKAIKVKATCLNCHGDKEKFSDELKQVLEEKYPDDNAFGFSIDDYRGALSVKIDWPEGKAALDSMMASM